MLIFFRKLHRYLYNFSSFFSLIIRTHHSVPKSIQQFLAGAATSTRNRRPQGRDRDPVPKGRPHSPANPDSSAALTANWSEKLAQLNG